MYGSPAFDALRLVSSMFLQTYPYLARREEGRQPGGLLRFSGLAPRKGCILQQAVSGSHLPTTMQRQLIKKNESFPLTQLKLEQTIHKFLTIHFSHLDRQKKLGIMLYRWYRYCRYRQKLESTFKSQSGRRKSRRKQRSERSKRKQKTVSEKINAIPYSSERANFTRGANKNSKANGRRRSSSVRPAPNQRRG